MKVLEVVGCRSSVVRALVAKARGPGFDSSATTEIFSHFTFASLNPLVPELFGRAGKNLISYRGIVHYRFIFLTRCWLGKPHSNHISLNRPRVWDSPHFLIEKIE